MTRRRHCAEMKKTSKRTGARALDDAMNFRGPVLVNLVISQGSIRKPEQFCWLSERCELR